MFEVKNANKKLLDSLATSEKAKKAKVCKVVYGIFKALGIGAIVLASVNFGITGAIFATTISGFIVGMSWLSKDSAKIELESENDEKVKLAIELASNLGVEIDAKKLCPELVATLDETEKATFVQGGEEIPYGDRGQRKYYYKFSDTKGGNHLLVETTTFFDDCELMFPSNFHGYGGYITRVNSSHMVSGLDAADEEALPREVVAQIANYEAGKQQSSKPHTKSRKR